MSHKKRKGKHLKRAVRLAVLIIGILIAVLLVILKHEQNYKDEETPEAQETRIIEVHTAESSNTADPKNDNVPEHEYKPEEPVSSNEASIKKRASELVSDMTLDEKICQMFILTPEQLTGVGNVIVAGEITKESLEHYPVGGLIYLGTNIKNPTQIKNMLSTVQKYAIDVESLPLFLCVDEEGGRIARIGGNPEFDVPKIKPMSEMNSVDEVYEAGNTIGKYLREYGFNVDFAPDCDVLTNKDNSIIGNRSFGADADIVMNYSEAYIKGLHNNGILGSYKHFPGHGATAGDTHKGFAYTDKSLNELMEQELKPFGDAENAEADMVMVSHISVPSILEDNTPCSLSYYMVTEVLRNMMGYNGIIITDAMNMGAIANEYSSKDAAVMAIKAGNDMILVPKDFPTSLAAVHDAVDNGEIGIERIDESVLRIISKKIIMMDADY